MDQVLHRSDGFVQIFLSTERADMLGKSYQYIQVLALNWYQIFIVNEQAVQISQDIFKYSNKVHASRHEKCCTFSLSLVNRFDKTKSAIYMFKFRFGCSQGINFYPYFHYYCRLFLMRKIAYEMSVVLKGAFYFFLAFR